LFRGNWYTISSKKDYTQVIADAVIHQYRLDKEEKKLNSKKGKNLKYTKNMKKHKEFVELIKEKYSNFETIIQDSNIITDPLSLLFYNDFIEFGKEEVLDMKIEEFTSEYTRFLKELI
jgi:NDP-sugar pyrophosphorylase family protein